MSEKVKKYVVWLLCAIVAMLVWIFIAVVLTGGREVEEFTDADGSVMTAFLVIFFLTAIVVLALAGKLGVEIGRQRREGVLAPEKREKKECGKSGTALIVVSVLIAFATMIGGIFLGKTLPEQMRGLFDWMLGLSILAALLTLLLNMVFGMLNKTHWEKQQVSQIQRFVYSHREQAEKTARQKLKFLKRIRCATAVYACFLAAVGLCMALSTGVLYSEAGLVTFGMVAALLILMAVSRIRFRAHQQELEDDRACVRAVRYPVLYQLAEKAAEQLGCYDSVRIMLMANCNAGILKVNNTYYVQLGVLLINVLSEEELYAVLLHEFSHVAQNNKDAAREHTYHSWLQGGGTPHFANGLAQQFFTLPDTVYKEQYMLYAYASSILIEIEADQTMLLYGLKEAAASALGKLKYYELFSWEKGTYDEKCIYQSEQPPADLLKKELEKFRKSIIENEEKWKALIDVEIQSRSATHPVIKSRLQALGIQDLKLLAAPEDTQYASECRQALAYVDEQICQDLTQDYKERRRVYYLEPKERVEAWKAADMPVVPSEYSDIVWALRQLGENMLALELCQRAVEQLHEAAAVDGYFMRGCYRLHSYDMAGIEDINTAMEANSNYWEEGLAVIGAFCCLTGHQEELDKYREKAPTLAQKYKDDYSRIGELKPKDKLLPEKLPDGMLEDILDYIASVEEGQIEKIYLVRKVISAEVFSSVFVLRFSLETADRDRNEIMHKVFRYLDTCSDWQFSLFDYEDVMKVPIYKIENSCVYERIKL